MLNPSEVGQNHYVFSVLQHAEAYARLGIPPIPIPFRQKGPVIPRWQKMGPSEGLQAVQNEAQQGQPLNLGIVTGTRCMALDFDRKGGVDGFENFLQWCEARGHSKAWLAEHVPYAVSGGGGLHFLFQMPPGIKIPSKARALDIEGFDVRATGGQIVVAPSQHKSRNHYEWKIAPWQVPSLPNLPSWLVQALSSPHEKTHSLPPRNATPDRDTFENRIAEISRKRSIPADSRKAKQILQLFEGYPIAEDGGGHDAFLGVTELIARLWPQADPSSLMEYIQSGIESRIALGRKTSIEEVTRLLVGAQRKYAAVIEERDGNWRGKLDIGLDGLPKASPTNVLIILREHEDWQQLFRYNTRTTDTVLVREPPFQKSTGPAPRAMNDTDSTCIQEWFHLVERMTVKIQDIERAVELIAEENEFDPVAEWFLDLKWDGFHRIHTWIHDYMGAEDTPLNREFGLRWLISAVARTLRRNNDMDTGPGCKVDTALTAIGPQGYGKSSAFRALVPEAAWFTDHLSPITSKDAKQEIHGPLIVEIGELQALRKLKDQEDARNFLTIQQDRFRPAYGRRAQNFPRTNVFCGTTNEAEPFRDATGARRFWPFQCVRRCRHHELASVRDQLWAEAVHLYLHENYVWWLADPAEELAREVQRSHYEAPEEVLEVIQNWIDKHLEKPFITFNKITEDILGVYDINEKGRLNKKVSDAMTYLNWEKMRFKINEKFVRVWGNPVLDKESVRKAVMEYNLKIKNTQVPEGCRGA